MKEAGFSADRFLLSIVIPVFNERATIAETLRAVLAAPYRKEIIVVDDGSTDGTREVLQGLEHSEIRVFLHERNTGKGSAVRTGFSRAGGDIILIQDGDLEYDPADYPLLLQPILSGKADVVYGSRFSGHGAHRVLYYWHFVGNKILTTLSNVLTDINLTDM
ncbi:MAG: glycosyltransferase family 2 protein, partial [Pseudomonadota bacterium]